MIGRCQCKDVEWICPPIPAVMVPKCIDCETIITWEEE